MRLLTPPPTSLFDPSTGALNAGSFRGGLPGTDLAPLGKGLLYRATHEKRWVYAAITTDELVVALAVVHLGYASNAFAFAFRRGGAGLAVDWSGLGLPTSAEVSDRAGEGCVARFQGAGALRIERPLGSPTYDVQVDVPGLTIDARLSTLDAPLAIGAVARVPGGLVNATEKRTLLPVSGEAVVSGVRHSLDGGLGGYDYTHGYLARRTAWRWGFALGRATTGEKVAFNLVQGFVGEAECAAWVDGELFPLPEGRFELRPEAIREPWRVRTAGGPGGPGSEADGSVDLRFEPGGVHSEHKNFVVVASRFLHPVGAYSGTLRVPGKELQLDHVLGVAEDQEVLW